MTTVRSDSSVIQHSARPDRSSAAASIALPAWVDEALRGDAEPRHSQRTIDGFDIELIDGGTLALCSAQVNDTASLGAVELRAFVTRAYNAIFHAANELAASNRVRMWSFIPGIHAPREDGLSTYHVFNQGRFDAFVRTLGGDAAFASGLPTATGVGHDGRDLFIHCLTSTAPGVHVENPRQVPAYRYSARYGPRPPCFARGTIVPMRGGTTLLIGGTASVRNEVSMYEGDLKSQIDETFENLAALTLAAQSTWGAGGTGEEATRSTASFSHLRVYYSQSECEQLLRAEVRRRVGPKPDIELIAASLCREDLLVEIEGVVELQGSC